jgi:hypothetical protein
MGRTETGNAGDGQVWLSRAPEITARTSYISGRACATFLLIAVGLSSCALAARQATIVYLDVDADLSSKDIDMTLDRSFVEAYKNRVTIDAKFIVDKGAGKPLPREIDGDLHIAGRSPEIELPTVAEIANAADEKAAVDLVHSVEGTDTPIQLTGVWRLWPEHAGKQSEVQGASTGQIRSATPSHVFEIHPVVTINGLDVRDSFRPVPDFKPGDAKATLDIYQKANCTITVKSQRLVIRSQKGLYNDIELMMALAPDSQMVVNDGRFVMAAALTLKGDTVVPRLRFVFVKGTPPEEAVSQLKPGDHLHIYGMPRVSFAEISRRVAQSRQDPSLLTESLPYEITVYGVYPDKAP